MSNYCFYEEYIYIYIEEDMTKDKNGKSVEICLSASFRGY